MTTTKMTANEIVEQHSKKLEKQYRKKLPLPSTAIRILFQVEDTADYATEILENLIDPEGEQPLSRRPVRKEVKKVIRLLKRLGRNEDEL